MRMELERRYRGLPAAYPKEHRERHAEEMIAVLMAGAEPGRRWPALRDAYDVVCGGLAIRLQRAADQGSRRHWRDAADVAALIAPLLLFAAKLFRVSVYTGRRRGVAAGGGTGGVRAAVRAAGAAGLAAADPGGGRQRVGLRDPVRTREPPAALSACLTLVIGLPAAAVLGVTGWLARTGRMRAAGE
jgi:hypothetical protein